jgi:DNA-binding transcriptional regulator YiaG
MADRIGVHWNTIARWERDEVGIPEPAARLARLLVTLEKRTAKHKRRR